MLNSTCFQGRLTADPELRTTASGIENTEFTVAWSEKYNEVERKCFLRCKAWRQTARFINAYFFKGQEIAVMGKLLTEEWEKDGQKQSRTLLSVEQAHFCGSKSKDSTAKPKPAAASAPNVAIDEIDEDEDLPF